MECPLTILYRNYHTLPIPLLYKFQVLCFMYKYIHYNELIPPALQNYFTLNSTVHSHDTRSKSNFHIFTVNKTFGLKTVAYSGSKLWNDLPDSLKNITSFTTFKKTVKTFLLDNYL